MNEPHVTLASAGSAPQLEAKPLPSIPNAIATVGGIVSFAGLFVPITKDFFIAHPLWGWAAFFGTVAVVPVIIELMVRRRASRLSSQLNQGYIERERSTERLHKVRLQALQEQLRSLDRSYRAKDIALLRDRTAPWGHESRFFEYLVNDVNHEHLPTWFASELDDVIGRWQRDTREIADPAISAIWRECRESANSYSEKLNECMHVKTRRSDVLEVPPEWEHDDRKIYLAAFTALQENRSRLEEALREVHRMLHSG